MSTHPSHAATASAIAPLLPGETVMPHAPSVALANGSHCIPQHFLRYEQTARTIADIVHDIAFDPALPIFAGADGGGLYLQVGVIGRENYDRGQDIRPKKLVYGRKWRIESYTPTSEIIQTAFLALKKAREHELREMLTISDAASGKTSAPFSSHMDLPLMARNRELVAAPTEPATPRALTRWLAGVRFGQRGIEVTELLARPHGAWLVDLRLGAAPPARQAEGEGREWDDLAFSLLLPHLCPSELLHEIMATLIQRSDRQVDEQFTYQGFARFSRAIDACGALEGHLPLGYASGAIG